VWEVLRQFAGEMGIVGHATGEQIIVERQFGVSEQHGKFRPRKGLAAPGALAIATSSGRNSTRVKEAALLERLHQAGEESRSRPGPCVRPAKAPASADNCLRTTSVPTSSVIAASRAVAVVLAEATIAFGARQRDLEIDLDVGGVDPGRNCRWRRCELDAFLTPLRCAALGRAEDWRLRQSPGRGHPRP